MWKRIISVVGTTLAVCIAVPATAGAASEYDDIIDKVSTKTLIHHIDNYHGKTCGSPNDDYAKKWLFSFKQKRYYSGDPKDHQAAVESLERAMSSPKGAYAVIYEQNNKDNGTAYLIKVFWTEDGKDDYTYHFYKSNQTSGIALARKEGSQSKLYVATIASPKLVLGVSNCAPEYLWGYKQSQAFTSDLNISIGLNKKLFTSTFSVDYPSGYAGPKFPDNRSAIGWWPDSSQYDDFTEKITTKDLVSYINRNKKFCAPADHSNSWFATLRQANISVVQGHLYHNDYMMSLERAMATGAYAVAYSAEPSGPRYIIVYWSENRKDFHIKFYGDAPYRTATITHKWGSNAKLYGMFAGNVKPFWGRGGCEVEFLQGNYSNNAVPIAQFNESYMPWYAGNNMKIFTSTFDVEYPDGYKGKPIPGDRRNIKYLALGDSFSSGEGDTDKNPATDRKYYRQWTDVNEDKAKGAPREKCHVSTRSYPYKLANWMGLGSGPSAAWASIACSGATVYDMNWDNSGGYEGQDSPLGRLHGYDNKGVLQKMALNEMIPGRVKQIEFVKKYQPKVITLTAGGNDAGFGAKLTLCVNHKSWGNSCMWAKPEYRSWLKADLKYQYYSLKSLYEDLKKATNDQAKIYVLGYPQFINGDPTAQCKNTFTLDAREREMITNSVTYYNKVIKQAAKAAGVKYIDVENAFGNHWLCGDRDSHVTAITGFAGWRGNEQQESFHPNAKGHSDIARKFATELGGVSPLRYAICENGRNSCPDSAATINTIEDTEYFKKGQTQDDLRVINYKLSNGTATKVQEKYIEIKTSRRPYKPWKKVYVKIYSEPRDLGEIEADKNGEINGSVALPEDLPVGYHTLVVSGEAPDGKKQELYQTILIKGPNPDDIDENGTPDKLQPCGAFAQAANKDEDLDGIDDACDPEVTDPILYTARNGRSSLGEDEDRIYLFRNTRAANLTGVTNDYVDKSKNQNSTDALVGHTLSEETHGLAFNKLVVMKEADSDIKKGTPIILAKDVNEKCYALKPEDHLSPALKPGAKDYKLRGLIKLNRLPKGVSCEE